MVSIQSISPWIRLDCILRSITYRILRFRVDTLFHLCHFLLEEGSKWAYITSACRG
uniref:Uncharacterized protein n=1 Tax=Rhizophora mucronata TaxID=61149 RepID=A0A2P2J3N0_RHIMU